MVWKIVMATVGSMAEAGQTAHRHPTTCIILVLLIKMLTSSGSSKRLLVFHGSSPHRSVFSRRGASTEKHNDTTTSCFGLEELNPENKMASITKASCNVERSEADLRAALAAKE